MDQLLLQASEVVAVDTSLQTLAGAGVPGALLVIVLFALYKVSAQLQATQEARVADAQKVVQAALDREERWQEVLTDLTKAVEADRAERERTRRNP